MPDDRISKIDALQQALQRRVTATQAKLLALLTDALESIYKDPEKAEALLKTFTAKLHQPLITQFGSDLLTIGELNSEYFQDLVELSDNAFAPIKQQVGKTMLTRFGLTKEGKLLEGGFLDSFIQDTSVKREIKQYLYKAKTGGVGLSEFSKGLRKLITDSEESPGVLTRYYRTYSYNTYAIADRGFQEGFAIRLELDAFIFAGGLITGSRQFCKDRNGKVFLRSEALEWKNLEFSGKPKNYDPLQDLGGEGCRHSKNYITNAMAMRRRDDLEEVNGRLRVKS